MRFLLRLILNGAAVFLAAQLIPGIGVDGPGAALAAGIVLGVINAIVRPLLILLTLPATLLTLGLFIFVINGVLFWLVGSFVQGFHVAGFWSALWGAIVYSIISWALSALILPA